MDRPAGRARQRQRTRKDLLVAAARLAGEGRTPSIDAVAEAAAVSRATAYRYFPNVEALLAEAALDVAVPDPAELFRNGPDGDPVSRLERVDAAVCAAIAANEPALRVMLAHTVLRAAGGANGVPARQNRRMPLIEAALAPAKREFAPGKARLLAHALALVIGTEAMVALKDVVRLDEAGARAVRRFAIRALVDAAKRAPKEGGGS